MPEVRANTVRSWEFGEMKDGGVNFFKELLRKAKIKRNGGKNHKQGEMGVC